MKWSVLAAALMGMALSHVGHAASVTYTGNFSGVTDVTHQVINVAQFDASLGLLQSATFTLSATMNTSAFAANDGNFYVGWDKDIYSLSLTGDAPYSSIAIDASNPATRLVGTGTVDSNFTTATMAHIITGVNPSSWTFNGPTLSASQAFTPAALSAFIGAGNLSFLLTTQNWDTLSVAGTQTGGTPPSSQGLSTSISSAVSVTYNYAPAAPVPEPATILMGLAALALMMPRRYGELE